jgi:hypothetical protein
MRRTIRSRLCMASAIACSAMLLACSPVVLGSEVNQRESFLNEARNYRGAAEVERSRGNTAGAAQLENLARDAEQRASSLQSLTPIQGPENPGTQGSGISTPPGSPSAAGKPPPSSNISGSTQPPPMDSHAIPGPGTAPKPDYRTADFQTLRSYSNALPAQERQRSREISTQARGLIDQREFGAARIVAQQALEADPGNAQAHFFAGEAARGLGNLVEARLHYGYAARFDPNDVVLSALATDRLQNLDKPTGASTGAAAEILGSANLAPPSVQPAQPDLLTRLQGAWCGRDAFGENRMAIAGTQLTFTLKGNFGNSGNAGSVSVLDERFFYVSLFGSRDKYEMIDPNKILWVERNGRPAPQSNIFGARC